MDRVKPGVLIPLLALVLMAAAAAYGSLQVLLPETSPVWVECSLAFVPVSLFVLGLWVSRQWWLLPPNNHQWYLLAESMKGPLIRLIVLYDFLREDFWPARPSLECHRTLAELCLEDMTTSLLRDNLEELYWGRPLQVATTFTSIVELFRLRVYDPINEKVPDHEVKNKIETTCRRAFESLQWLGPFWREVCAHLPGEEVRELRSLIAKATGAMAVQFHESFFEHLDELN